jgi:hypothetical protein
MRLLSITQRRLSYRVATLPSLIQSKLDDEIAMIDRSTLIAFDLNVMKSSLK